MPGRESDVPVINGIEGWVIKKLVCNGALVNNRASSAFLVTKRNLQSVSNWLGAAPLLSTRQSLPPVHAPPLPLPLSCGAHSIWVECWSANDLGHDDIFIGMGQR